MPYDNETRSIANLTGTDRRTFLAASGAAGAAGTLGLAPWQPAEAVEMAKLMADTGLPELSMGPRDAKVTVVEYASMTCGHCMRFHTETFPKLKEQYIEPGKIHFVFREFPLDNLAAAASMLARCSGDDKAFRMVSVLFGKFDDWIRAEKPVPALFEMAKQVGFTKESFETCLKDQELLDKILAQRERASKEFKVTATPTFFINGNKLEGTLTIENFAKVIDPMLAEG